MSDWTVPQAAEALRAYYRLPGNSMGGVVHIITEDGNTKQGHAEGCLEQARAGGDPADIAVASMLAAMTRTQRTKLSRMAFYPDADPVRGVVSESQQ